MARLGSVNETRVPLLLQSCNSRIGNCFDAIRVRHSATSSFWRRRVFPRRCVRGPRVCKRQYPVPRDVERLATVDSHRDRAPVIASGRVSRSRYASVCALGPPDRSGRFRHAASINGISAIDVAGRQCDGHTIIEVPGGLANAFPGVRIRAAVKRPPGISLVFWCQLMVWKALASCA